MRNFADGRDLCSAEAALKSCMRPSTYSSVLNFEATKILPMALSGFEAATDIFIRTTVAYATRTKLGTGRHLTVSVSCLKKTSKTPSIAVKHADKASTCEVVNGCDDFASSETNPLIVDS
jgi:hypothetical protein